MILCAGHLQNGEEGQVRKKTKRYSMGESNPRRVHKLLTGKHP
jgi:hypothetical protein